MATPAVDVGRTDSNETEELDEMSLQKAMLQAKFRLSNSDGSTQGRPQVRRLEDRSNHFEQIRRQLRAEEETSHFSHQAMYDEMERDIEYEAQVETNTDVDGDLSQSSYEGDEESDEEEEPLMKNNLYILNASSVGGRVWKQGSPVLYARLQRLMHYYCGKALRLRRDLKPVEKARSAMSAEHSLHGSPLLSAAHGEAVEHSSPTSESPPSIVQGTEVSLVQPQLPPHEAPYGLTVEQITDLAATLTRIDERESSSTSSSSRGSASDGGSSIENNHFQGDAGGGGELMAGTSSDDDNEFEECEEGGLDEESYDENGYDDEEEYTDEEDDDDADEVASTETPEPLSVDSARFPPISQLFARLKMLVKDAFTNWGRPLIIEAERIADWVQKWCRELLVCIDQMETLLVSPKYEMRIGERCRRLYHCLCVCGFPEASSMSTLHHDLSIVRGVEVQGYSYHPRLFPTMTTLNANLNAFGLFAVLNLEHSDRRLGRPSQVPMPHPHEEVNTSVILCEPRKKKNQLDDFRTLPHPKKAGIHGVEDFLVEEELQYRQCIQLCDHLNRHGTLKGLPSHLYPLVYALLDFDVEEFGKLLSSKRCFLASVPAGLIRKIIERLKRRLAQLEGSREAVRLAVGAVGFFCQGATWRDQVISSLTNFSKNVTSLQGMNELPTTHAPLLVQNPWAQSSQAEWLTKALQIFLSDNVKEHQWGDSKENTRGIFDVVVSICRGDWMGNSRCAQSVSTWWQTCWGPSGDLSMYILDVSLLQCVQALLGVAELLMKAKSNTVCDPFTFLEKFSNSKWRSDISAAAFLLGMEKARNTDTACLVALAPAIDYLRERWAAAVEQGSVAFFNPLSLQTTDEQYPSSAKLHSMLRSKDASQKRNLFRVLVSTYECSSLLFPTLAVVEVPWIDSDEAGEVS